jgi:hypothetical protein
MKMICAALQAPGANQAQTKRKSSANQAQINAQIIFPMTVVVIEMRRKPFCQLRKPFLARAQTILASAQIIFGSRANHFALARKSFLPGAQIILPWRASHFGREPMAQPRVHLNNRISEGLSRGPDP